MRWPWRRGRCPGAADATRHGGAEGRPRRRGGIEVLWADLVVAFVSYVTGLLVVGLALGGERARDVAVGNLAGVGLAVVAVAVLMLWRRRGHW